MTAPPTGERGRAGPSAVRIVLVYPDLLGTYGDSGNAVVLAQRLRWRGLAAEVVEVGAGAAVPASADLYVLGGGEDQPQSLAARAASRGGPITRAVDAGAAVLAVCAGLQILGTRFVGPDGTGTDGLGLLDCRTERGAGRRAVGEIVVDPDPATGLPPLSGYENHGGVTTLGPGARPAGTVRVGVGNGAGGVDGAWSGKVWGTYLHGPVLARNPGLADLLLQWVVGPLPPLEEADAEAERLRRERIAAAVTPGARSAAQAPARFGRLRALAAGAGPGRAGRPGRSARAGPTPPVGDAPGDRRRH